MTLLLHNLQGQGTEAEYSGAPSMVMLCCLENFRDRALWWCLANVLHQLSLRRDPWMQVLRNAWVCGRRAGG